ncbi:uncharacterized protein LOC101859451 isoform X1 [Aplysia californica]|uniref:Uncharacterized protein LOC101859451 isoform X1 n=1 Tax=Aplysia californica TaxID=6500 RepID=A0ABM0JAY6_APLCA|nr:uncharacterized protein LOC101859451 isoform X1 [Aplysia californica]
MNGESANKFISALVKSLQTLCQGYVEFNDGIEIIGHLYLNIDSGSSFDYIVKEKVCKNAENSTIFVSKSYAAQTPPDEVITRRDKGQSMGNDQGADFEDASMSPTAGTSRLQSAITSISNVLSGAQDNQKSRHMSLDHSHLPSAHSIKRKREHNGNYSGMHPPYKYTTLQSSSSSSAYFNSAPSKQAADRNHSEQFSSSSHAEFFGGDSNQSSDPSSSQSNLHDNSSVGGGSIGYPNSDAPPQQFTSGTAGDLGALSQSFQDPSQLDMGQHHIQGPPNPRNDATAGPPPRMPDGVKPLCGYVHHEDAEKWMMIELLPGSGVFIHQENYNVVMSKTRQDRPDGKAMARYLMSCFWRQSELVGASIAEPPKPHQKSLDRGIVHAILGFCQHHSRELPTDIRRTIQQKIGYAKFYFVKKTQDPDSPKTTPASISVEASPRRMSMEMARRAAGGALLPESMVRSHSRRGRKSGQHLSRGMSEPDDVLSRLPVVRGGPDAAARGYSDLASDGSDRLGEDGMSGRLSASSSSEILSDRLPSDITSRLPGNLCNRITSDLARRMSTDLAGRVQGDFSSRMVSELAGRTSTSEHMGRAPEDLSSRGSAELPTSSAAELPSRMTSEISNRLPSTAIDVMSGRTTEGGIADQANRMGAMPSGMSRGFLDMLNNIYPNN